MVNKFQEIMKIIYQLNIKNMAQEKNLAAREAAMVRNNSVFNHLFLADGNLYAEGRKCPVMKNVKKVSVGSRYNKIVTQDGVYVFTPDWQTLVSFAKQHSVQLQGYRVSAETEIAVDSDLELVKGENMKVSEVSDRSKLAVRMS